MITAEEQYRRRYNEIRNYYKKVRKRRILLCSVVTIISILAILISWKFYKTNESMILFCIVIAGILAILFSLREIAYSIFHRDRAEKQELNELRQLYQADKFFNRNEE